MSRAGVKEERTFSKRFDKKGRMGHNLIIDIRLLETQGMVLRFVLKFRNLDGSRGMNNIQRDKFICQIE